MDILSKFRSRAKSNKLNGDASTKLDVSFVVYPNLRVNKNRRYIESDLVKILKISEKTELYNDANFLETMSEVIDLYYRDIITQKKYDHRQKKFVWVFYDELNSVELVLEWFRNKYERSSDRTRFMAYPTDIESTISNEFAILRRLRSEADFKENIIPDIQKVIQYILYNEILFFRYSDPSKYQCPVYGHLKTLQLLIN